MRYIMSLLFFCILLTGCHQAHDLSWNDAMLRKISSYSAYSQESFSPYFAQAQLPYAPQELAFLVFKESKQFEIYARNKDAEPWHFIKTFPIYAASGDVGPKLHAGDRQVPEGIYHIIALNPRSHFDLSMQLDYPNAFDVQEAQLEHRTNLGGDIFIHGNKKSVGCIALGNAAIRQIFPLVYAVGEHHVTVIIAPDDLRKNAVITNREHLPWVPNLYSHLKRELKQFPLV